MKIVPFVSQTRYVPAIDQNIPGSSTFGLLSTSVHHNTIFTYATNRLRIGKICQHKSFRSHQIHTQEKAQPRTRTIGTCTICVTEMAQFRSPLISILIFDCLDNFQIFWKFINYN